MEKRDCSTCVHFEIPPKMKKSCYGCHGTKDKKGWEPIEKGEEDENKYE